MFFYTKKWQLTACLGLLAWIGHANALNNGVGVTPAMGWSSWNYFRCNINETLVKQVADAMVATGLRDAGYKYVNIDDCWMEKRGPDGKIMPFKDKFPSGMKALADYIHSKGLLFGVYSDTGNNTCEGYPGSWGYERLDAATYAEWGVDYLKYDYCGMEKSTVSVRQSYEIMRDALNATGRPILYSLCSWGTGSPWEWGMEVGNSWRAGIDVFSVWDAQEAKRLKLPNFLQSIATAIESVENYADHAGPGGFNDPDMLVIGLDGMYPYGIVQDCPEHVKGCKPGMYISRDQWGQVGGLSHTEQKSHFAFWCMLASPLLLGNDPRSMSRATLSILTAPEIIALSQDALGKQAKKVWFEGTSSIWVKPITGGRMAVLLFNAGDRAVDITLNFTRDLPGSASWARNIPGLDPVCIDALDGCPGWAQSGECEKNPAFMLTKCAKSCPAGCPYPLGGKGPKVTAVVRDAWLQDDLGAFVAVFKAHLVEPHEARVVTVTFMEPADAVRWEEQRKKASQSGAPVITRNGAGSQPKQQAPSDTGTTGTAGSRRELRADNVREQALVQEIQKLAKEIDAANEKLGTLNFQLKTASEFADRIAEDLGGPDHHEAEPPIDNSWLMWVLALVIGSNMLTALVMSTIRRRARKSAMHMS